MAQTILPQPHEQRKIEQLLVKLSKVKPISAKPAPIVARNACNSSKLHCELAGFFLDIARARRKQRVGFLVVDERNGDLTLTEMVLPRCSGRHLGSSTVLRSEWEVLLRRACVIRRVVRAALARIPRYFGISAQWMRPSLADATIRSGAVPSSTHVTITCMWSKLLAPGPPVQCSIPGIMNRR